MTPDRFRLLPSALLSIPVFGVSLLWVLVVQLAEWVQTGEAFGTLAVRLTLMCVVQVLMFAFPFATWRVLCPRVRPEYWTRLLLGSLVVGAAIRGIVLGSLLVLTGVTESPDIAFRVGASLSHLAVITVLLWFLVSEVRGLHALRRQLIAEREQLLTLQQSAQRDLDEFGARTTEEIRHSIMQSLGGMQGGDSAEFRERLRVTIDDVVRPLSHQLAAQPSAWLPPPPLDRSPGVDWRQAVREGLDPRRIHPVIVPVLLIWMGLPIHLFRYGAMPTAALVATLIVTIPTFWLARMAAIRLSAGRGSGPKGAAFVIAVLVGGLSLGVATLSYMHSEPQPFLFVAVAPILSLLISGPLAVAEAARDQDLALDSELCATTADLRWALARARERHRQQETALARALHGRLQASLAAAFLRLDRAAARGADDDGLLEALRLEIGEAISSLDVIDSEPDPIDKVLALTQSNWSDVVHLGFSIDPPAREALAEDLLCARSVNDLIPELVFNSIRHAGAGSIEVSCDLADHRSLRLSVIDDGRGELITTRYGLGSTLLDEASITWSRTRSGGRTTTTCVLPILSAPSAFVSP